jgi:DNA polymerase-3 subunit alpha
MLGTYISDHPLNEVAEPQRSRQRRTVLSACATRSEELAQTGQAVTVGGILSEVQIRTNQSQPPYARVVLEDLGASMEINFSASFEKFSGFLAKDNIVLMKVRVSDNDEELRFSAVDVERFERSR